MLSNCACVMNTVMVVITCGYYTPLPHVSPPPCLPPLSPLPPCLPSPPCLPPLSPFSPCLPSPLVSPPLVSPPPLSSLPLVFPSPLSPLPPCLPSPLASPPPLSPLPPCLCQVLDKFTSLPHIFSAFRQCLVDSDGMLKKHKEKFRTGLLQDAEDFKRSVNDLVEAFESSGPFTSEATQEQVRRWEAELSAGPLSLTVPLVLPSHSPPSLHNYSYSPIPCLFPLPLPAPSCPSSFCPTPARAALCPGHEVHL